MCLGNVLEPPGGMKTDTEKQEQCVCGCWVVFFSAISDHLYLAETAAPGPVNKINK